MLAVRRWGIVCAPPQSLPSFSFFLTPPPPFPTGACSCCRNFSWRERREAEAEGEALQHCVAAGRKAREEAGSPPPPPPFQAARGETQLCPCALLPSSLSPSPLASNGALQLLQRRRGEKRGRGSQAKKVPPPHRRQLQQQSTNGRRGTELSVAGKTPQRLRRLRRGRRGGGWDRSRGLHRAGRRVWCVGPSSQCRQGRKFAAAEEEETVAVAQAGFGGGACAAVVTATQRGEEDGRVLPSIALLSWSYLLRRR